MNRLLPLVAIQICQYFISFVVLPIVSRSLGPNDFGYYSNFVSIVLLNALIVDFGLSIIGAKKSVGLQEGIDSNELYTTIIGSRLVIALMMLLVLFYYLFTSSISYSPLLICVFIFGIIIAVISPSYIYQSTNRLITLSGIPLLSRAILVPTFLAFSYFSLGLNYYIIAMSLTLFIPGMVYATLNYRLITGIQISKLKPNFTLIRDGFIVLVSETQYIIITSVAVLYTAATIGIKESGVVLLMMNILRAAYSLNSVFFTYAFTKTISLSKIGVLQQYIGSKNYLVEFSYIISVIMCWNFIGPIIIQHLFGNEYLELIDAVSKSVYLLIPMTANYIYGMRILMPSSRQIIQLFAIACSVILTLIMVTVFVDVRNIDAVIFALYCYEILQTIFIYALKFVFKRLYV